MSERLTDSPRAGDTEPPPILGSWPRLYALVIGALVVEIVLLAWVSGIGR